MAFRRRLALPALLALLGCSPWLAHAQPPVPTAVAKAGESPLLDAKMRQACQAQEDEYVNTNTANRREMRDLNLLRLAAAVSLTPAHLLTSEEIAGGKARFLKDGGPTNFELDAPGNVQGRAITTFWIASSPREVGIDRDIGDSAGKAGLSANDVVKKLDAYGIRQLDWVQVQGDATPGDDVSKMFRLTVQVPDMMDMLTGPWFIRRGTFVVVSCPRKTLSDSDAPRVYAGDYTVSVGWMVFAYAAGMVIAIWLVLASIMTSMFRNTAGRSARARPTLILNPLVLTQDELGFGSASRLQVFFFSMVVATAMTYVLLRTGALSDISSDLLLLLGIGGVSATATKMVGNIRAEDETDLTPRSDNWLTRHGITWPPRTAHFRDLLVVGNTLDVTKLQAVIFSAIVGFWILSVALTELGTLSVPPHVMALLGVSQALYVGGRATHSGVSRSDLNNRVRNTIDLEQAFFACLAADHPYWKFARARAQEMVMGGAGTPGEPDAADIQFSPDASKALQSFRDAAFGVARAAAALRYGGSDAGVRVPDLWRWPIWPPDDIPPDRQPTQT